MLGFVIYTVIIIIIIIIDCATNQTQVGNFIFYGLLVCQSNVVNKMIFKKSRTSWEDETLHEHTHPDTVNANVHLD